MPTVEDEIRSAIATYLKDPSALGLTIDLANLSRALDALPVYADMGGALLIRPNGEVLEVSSDLSWTEATPQYSVVDDPEWIQRAYDKCALRFPQLRATIDRIKVGRLSDI